MVTLNHPLQIHTTDLKDSRAPLVSEVDMDKHFFKSRKAESREFFISRERNLYFSFLLLLAFYAAVLFPILFVNEDISSEKSPPGDMVLLNRSAALLAQACRSGWSGERLRHLPTGLPLREVPVFLKDSAVVQDFLPPMGLQGSEEKAARVLRALPHRGLPLLLGTSACKRCVVVGSGGVLHGSQLGAHINQYDIIIRMNNAPVFGFKRDAGSRTTIRLIYPEGAPHSPAEYDYTTLVALVVFKGVDLDWLNSVVTRKPLSWWTKLWFWRGVVESIPLKPENFRILNPEIMHQTALALQAYTKKQTRTVPTLGASAVVAALQLCDEVSLAGFGYDQQHPEAPLHYYETLHTDAMQAQVVHDISAETAFLRELVRVKAVSDLTGALY